MNSCPFDYVTYDIWIKRTAEWNKNNPEKCKKYKEKSLLKKKMLIAKKDLNT